MAYSKFAREATGFYPFRVPPPWLDPSACVMRHHIGVFLQFVVLVFLPMLIIWQLEFGFRLILMPALTLVGIVVFWIGYKLREG